MNSQLTESTVETPTLDWLRALGYGVLFGPGVSGGGMASGQIAGTVAR